ncbi:LCP family protein [Geodermatophilus sp. SYSU D00758]
MGAEQSVVDGRRPQHAAPGGPRPRRRGLRRVLVVLGVLGLVLALVVGGGLWFLTDRYAGNVARVADVFADLDADARPAPATPQQAAGEAPVTFLLVGSDTRATAEEGIAAGGRSDAIMLARFSADRQHAQVVSLPRDSWVEIPGHGMGKINAAYAYGGPSLLVQTVEQLTGVRVDHYVAIDFEGITEVTDDLGGVDVVVAETTSNGPHTFEAGVNHLDGDEARWYLAQRYGLAAGDFDRVRRQQQYLKAVFTKLLSTDTLTDPGRLDAALLSMTGAVAVDEQLGNTELLSLAYDMRGLGLEGIDFLTAPVLGTGTEGAASVVYLDHVAGERMWEYLRNDSLSQNADEFADEALPDVPR